MMSRKKTGYLAPLALLGSVFAGCAATESNYPSEASTDDYGIIITRDVPNEGNVQIQLVKDDAYIHALILRDPDKGIDSIITKECSYTKSDSGVWKKDSFSRGTDCTAEKARETEKLLLGAYNAKTNGDN